MAAFLASSAWLIRSGRYWWLPFLSALLALFSLRLTYASSHALHMFDGTIPAWYLALMALFVLASGTACWLVVWLLARRWRWAPRSGWILGIAWMVAMFASEMEGCDNRAIHVDNRCPWSHHA